MASRTRFFDFELVERGDEDFDVVAGDAIIELSRDKDGAWRFWGVRVGKHQFGGIQHIGPGEFTDWLISRASRREDAS